MYHIYNTDKQTVKKVHKSELYGVLLDLENQGAVLSLDIDSDICYSFEDDWEGEDIDIIMTDATNH